MELETVKEHRILRADKLRADEVPISPRRFQQIKANCIRVQEEIDAQLKTLQRRQRPAALHDGGARGARHVSPKRRRTPKGSGGSLQDRLRRKIALRRASSEPLLDAAPLVPPGGSVALELQRELGKGPLKPEELSRFLAARESSRARAARSLPGGGGSAPASRPSSAVDFVTRNRRSATDFQWQHRVQLEMQNLRRCARTDLAKKKRQMQLEEMHRAAAEDYRNRFFRGDGSTSAGRGLRLHGAEEAEDEARVQLALENLAKYMPSKVMKLFTRLFDQETLFQIFSGEVADNMAMACRLYALVRRLISWSRTWKKKKAAEVLQGFMSIPPPLGFRVKLPIQRYVRRLKALQRTWRRFQWRLRSLTKHVYEQMWFKQENELLEDIFMFCPGDHATIVTCPNLLGDEPETYNLPSKEHKKGESPLMFGRPKSAKRGGMGTEDMMKKLLLDAFSNKKRESQFRPQVAKSIIRRELLERLYNHAQRLPVGVSWQKAPFSKSSTRAASRGRGLVSFGFPRAVLLTRRDLQELIFAAHRACGVCPTLEDRCDALLPCPAWRVKSLKKLLGPGRTLREGILDLRTASERPRNSTTSSASSASQGQGQGSSRPESAGSLAGARRGAFAQAGSEKPPRDVSSLTGAMLALHLLKNRRRRSSEGLSEDLSSQSSVESQGPEDVVDAALVYDRKALMAEVEEPPSQRPSADLATVEAGWPSAWRLWNLQEMLED
ncbi:unnamed protein product [Durusdinium trenchii]|uniref:Uncharacterized protein n=1 Tax=Durusdinium trenchii TaxID=1381693 RepID=A0ABP0KAX8_9DINO